MTDVPSLQAAKHSILGDPAAIAGCADALVLVGPAPLAAHAAALGVLGPRILEAASIDAATATPARAGRAPFVLAVPGAPGGRVIFAPTSSLAEETDDVRVAAEATALGTARAVEAGASRVLVLPLISSQAAARFARAPEVCALAALGTAWSSLEAREAARASKGVARVSVIGLAEGRVEELLALEQGRRIARDIAGTDPERMSPKRVAAYCREAFAGSSVKLQVHDELSQWPLLSAVGRASMVVDRHRPCVIQLDLSPSEPVRRTIILVGKGVTYDTGGADLKTDGAMAGASRDKGGAAAVAGFIHAASRLKLAGVRIVGLMGMVRNSIGEDSYVSDEIIVGKSGCRVRIGNTDAEGRLVLADLLASAKELAAGAPDPIIVSIATLTGHVYRAYGPYTGAIGNGPAAADLDTLDALGELWGEPIERSRARREDYAFVAGRSSAEDVVSSNRLPSVGTPRGHQFPFAFLDIASGIRGSGLPLIHLDIAGSAFDPPDWQFGRPTAVPLLTLAAWASRASR